ncbi:hypothetical protein ILYODFUR_027657 [Ilyodon furcidens]|uniref:Uncharacterized protein n=1 Tax=Ilyodon furcidens TaxID=33524 RepID=A0ABV0TNV7_9TELE
MLQIQRWQRTGDRVEQPPQVKHHRLPAGGWSLCAGALVVLGVWGWVLGCVPAHSLWDLCPSGSVWPLEWGGVPLGLGCLGSWLDLLLRSRLAVGPVAAAPCGFCTVAAGWTRLKKKIKELAGEPP